MKKIILLILILTPAIIYSQSKSEIIFKIIDSVIVKKNCPYATKINLEISVPDFQDTIFLYRFFKCIGSYALSAHAQEVLNSYGAYPNFGFDYMTMEYVIENEDYEVIDSDSVFFNILNKKIRTFRTRESIGTFVNSKQQIIRKKLNDRQRIKYNLAKYKISKPKQNVALYLLLCEYHPNLPKGEYYLYITYYFSPSWQSILNVNDTKIFKHKVVSNRVKLIVEF